ncbi:helix-turn-helix domain-containing protein [Thiocapsa marina]|uniref:Helix-turn-helix domain protein n=1 Tax=Thiocapsa marina 5811 TaxID=768671 RepID=F9UH47_9GAMM|nr:helix-turn-helix transcriptional regulator [Thiocapsa marina]EGV16451.1 helix-turn-helix domain protein [Thiocapsa marina 5811]
MNRELSRSEQIGQRLTSTRIRNGWSIEELALHTNGTISKSRISNFEAGLRRPDIEIAEILATTFGDVSAAWLLKLEKSPDSSAQRPKDEPTKIAGQGSVRGFL